ncbi:M23 family metallopeptidase [Mesobacillus sp. S13]|uniref:M23 family metallopeptidase n=1 Tax=Mesobacillus sp. S13 TaxID=2880221 RepID=UPI0021F3F8F4|nr:M23 family metallopeptidase [Mesobacillus sp. S13]
MIVRITSKFGEVSSIHKTPHTGIDIVLSEGTPLRSVYDGVIEKVYDGSTNIGKGIKIRFEDGTEGIYGHLSEVKVKVGEMVRDGQIVGLSGNTGRSTGEHLHFALQRHGEFVDPSSIVDKTVNYSWINHFFQNGKVGQIDFFSIPEWIKGKFTEATIGNTVDFISDMALALPIITVVSLSVYALLNMVSSRVAKLGALGTVVYSLIIIH